MKRHARVGALHGASCGRRPAWPARRWTSTGPCTASELAARLAARHGDVLRRLLLGADGRLSPVILVFVGDAQVGPDDRLALKDGDVITLLSPVAGG